MARLTVAALHKMARSVQVHDKPTVTLATHPEPGGGRYAAWPKGCILLPATLLEDLAFPADGSYVITAKGLAEPYELPLFTPAYVARAMLPLLDQPRIPATPSDWLLDRGGLLRLLDRPNQPATAVYDDLWALWTKTTEGPTWQAGDWAILWAPDQTARATALLGAVHHRYIPTPPEEPPL